MQEKLPEGIIYHWNKKTRRFANDLRVFCQPCRASKMPFYFLNQMFQLLELKMISSKDARTSESLVD